MFIKTKNGDYVNSKHISALRVKCHGGDFNVVADCTSYCGEPCFYTSIKKEDAQCYMVLLVNRLSEEEKKAEAMRFPSDATIKLLKSIQEFPEAARRGQYRAPLERKPMANQGTKLFAILTTLVDDFALSGDTDNLLKINAYIRMYLQQEAMDDASN
jgi:hypothetical protein